MPSISSGVNLQTFFLKIFFLRGPFFFVFFSNLRSNICPFLVRSLVGRKGDLRKLRAHLKWRFFLRLARGIRRRFFQLDLSDFFLGAARLGLKPGLLVTAPLAGPSQKLHTHRHNLQCASFLAVRAFPGTALEPALAKHRTPLLIYFSPVS